MTPAQARAIQAQLAPRVRLTPMRRTPRTVVGLDCAFSRDGRTLFAVAVVLRLPDLEVVESAQAAMPLRFPYIPGLLSFREAPVCLAACGRLKSTGFSERDPPGRANTV